MSRPKRPLKRYDGHESYPATREARLNRRDFIGRSAATAAVALGGASVAREVRAQPKFRDKRRQITYYPGRARIGKSQMSAQRVVLYVKDKRLAEWLSKYRNRRQVTTELRKVLRKAKDAVLVNGKALYRLERRLGAAALKAYRKKTGRGAEQPDAMLVLGRYWRPRLRGRIRLPRHVP